MYKRNIEARSLFHSCHNKAVSVTYSEWVSEAVVIKHAMRMRCIIVSSVVCLAVPYFSILSNKWHDVRKYVIEHKMCFDCLCNFFVKLFQSKNK
jgi:hypothetical protein